MEITKIEKVDTTIVVDIICDVCGLSCRDKKTGLIEQAILRANWGYGSDKDCEYWSVDLCEACADRLAVWVSSQGGKIRKNYCD